jgi:VWFA-related protein
VLSIARVALALSVAGSLGLSQEPILIRVPVRIVAVPTAVQGRDGHFVRGLQPPAFHLFDNDRRQIFRLEDAGAHVSLAIAVQTSNSVSAWLPHVRRIASTIEALALGETGEASLISFGDELKVLQPMTSSADRLDLAFRNLSAKGTKSRCLDALALAAKQLEETSAQHRRVILLIAQAGDSGSSSELRSILADLERNNISLHSLIMPRVGKNLIHDTISAQGIPHDSGFKTTLDLGKLVPEIARGSKALSGQDEITVLTTETGGRKNPFRSLHDLESGIAAFGEELHNQYLLTYTPDHGEPGYHRIRVSVDTPGTSTRSRP